MRTIKSTRQIKIACLAALSAVSLTSVCNAQLTTPTFAVDSQGLSAGALSTWANEGSGGAALNLGQGTGSAQPTVVAAATPSGLPAVRFDGGDFLVTGAVNSSALVGNTAGTLFFVLKPTAQSSSYSASIFQWQDTNQRLQFAENSQSLFYVHGNFGTTFDYSSTPYPSGWADNWHVVTVSRNGGSSLIRVDGQDVNGAISGGLSGISGTLTVGAAPGGASDQFIGDIAEIRVYSTAPGAGEVAAIENSLTTTYLTPVPEPSEYAMMFGALCIVGALARRAYRRQVA